MAEPAGHPAVYLLLLGVQTAAATLLFWMIFPSFQQVVLNAGRPQAMDGALVAEAPGR